MYQPIWSPDSKKLLWSNRRQQLQYVDIETKAVVRVAEAPAGEITDYAWSPDSKWIAFAKPEDETLGRIFLYSLESRQATPASDGWFAVGEPAFSADGKMLFFVSARSFNPTYSQTEFEHIYSDMSRIYLRHARQGDQEPVRAAQRRSQDQGRPEAGNERRPKRRLRRPRRKRAGLKVDLDGLAGRIAVLPTPAGNYRALTSVGNRLYYVRAARASRRRSTSIDFDRQAETQVAAGAGYEISADGRKMLLAVGERFAIVDAPSGRVEPREFLDLSDMRVTLDRHAEWRQIFNESWRQMRDFFYAPNMHGVDWPAMRAKYAPLVDHVNHRADLTYIIGEMIGELNAGHTYVGGGDLPRLERVPMGLLGARIERDAASKFFKIAKIFKGQNWDPALRSPLTDIGVERQGRGLHRGGRRPVHGRTQRPLGSVRRQSRQTGDVAGQCQPRRRAPATPSSCRSRTSAASITTIGCRQHLAKVSAATGGRVGYLHIPDMGVPGLNEFAKYYYPQANKEALIVDVRSNGGGNVSPMIIERLRRELVLVDIARNQTPQTESRGHDYRAKGAIGGRVLGIRRRPGDLAVQDAQDRPGHRQAHLGRRGRDPGHSALPGRRRSQQARVLQVRCCRQGLGHRRGGRRSRHRRGQRSGEGVCRRGPAAEQGHRGDPRPDEEKSGASAACAALPDQEVMNYLRPTTRRNIGPTAVRVLIRAQRVFEFWDIPISLIIAGCPLVCLSGQLEDQGDRQPLWARVRH